MTFAPLSRDALLTAANDNATIDKVVVASNYLLSQPYYVHRLAIAVVALDIPRRKLVDWVGDQIDHYTGRIVWASGAPFTYGDTEIYDVFNVEGDPSQRWTGDFYKFAVRAPIQIAQTRVVDRLRFINTAVCVTYPDRGPLMAK